MTGKMTGKPTRESILARDVSWTVAGRRILDRVSLAVPAGATLGLLGPNGSGKSSLLRILAGIRRPSSGSVRLEGCHLGDLSRRDVARRLAFVEQQATTEVDLTVLEVVRLGRIPHRRVWDGIAPGDDEAVAAAITRTDLGGHLERRWSQLSGGERQRVQIARALAQQPRELLLDEPTNHLDIRHQLDLMTLIATLPVTTVVALHDLNLAAAYCDRLVVLDRGRAVADGTPAEVLTPDLIADVYRVNARVTPDGPEGRPAVRFVHDLPHPAPSRLSREESDEDHHTAPPEPVPTSQNSRETGSGGATGRTPRPGAGRLRQRA